MIRPNAHVAAMDAYALADLSAPVGKTLVSLAQNESALPPSPKAIDAGREALESTYLYSDPDWCDLRQVISHVHGLDPQSILCGAGSLELIATVIRGFAGPGDEVLSTQYSYAFFKVATRAAGAEFTCVPEVEHTISVDALLAAVNAKTRIVCIANPGNPTGTRLPRAEIERLRRGLRDDILLLIDEAYGEFADAQGEFTFDLAGHGNCVTLRTFSKAYCLAGARVGWGIFPQSVGAQVRKLLNPNNVSSVSQAMATAAMADQAYMQGVCAQTAARLDSFAARLRELGLKVAKSHTNFALIGFESEAQAGAADQALRAHGILMRHMGLYGLPECLRATIGSDEDMARSL